MDWNTYMLAIVLAMMAHASDAATAGNSSDIIGMAVAASCCLVLLAVIIITAVFFFFWTTWFRKLMYQKGKVKMPQAYFQKKEDAKKRLISNSQNPLARGTNGSIPPQVVDRAPLVNDWEEGYTRFGNRVYEEKCVSVDIGEETDNVYTIEAEIVDNEVLDVGPFKHDHSKEVPVKGDVYPDPYIYSSVDKSNYASTNNYGKAPGASRSSAKKENDTPKLEAEYSTPEDEIKTSKFEQSLLYL